MSSRPTGMVLYAARLAAGPLALIGFFLPWADGPGMLAASEFSGFRLVGFAGRLEQLDLTLLQSFALWLVRFGVLGVLIAAVWHTALAPAHRWHRLYAASGWYLVVVMAAALVLGVIRSGVVLAPLGLALCAAGAALFALSETIDGLHRRWPLFRRAPAAPAIGLRADPPAVEGGPRV